MSYLDKVLTNQNMPYFVQEREESEKENSSDNE